MIFSSQRNPSPPSATILSMNNICRQKCLSRRRKLWWYTRRTQYFLLLLCSTMFFANEIRTQFTHFWGPNLHLCYSKCFCISAPMFGLSTDNSRHHNHIEVRNIMITTRGETDVNSQKTVVIAIIITTIIMIIISSNIIWWLCQLTEEGHNYIEVINMMITDVNSQNTVRKTSCRLAIIISVVIIISSRASCDDDVNSHLNALLKKLCQLTEDGE